MRRKSGPLSHRHYSRIPVAQSLQSRELLQASYAPPSLSAEGTPFRVQCSVQEAQSPARLLLAPTSASRRCPPAVLILEISGERRPRQLFTLPQIAGNQLATCQDSQSILSIPRQGRQVDNVSHYDRASKRSPHR